MINLLPFAKKDWIQNTANLKNYTWNIVENVIVIDLPLKNGNKIAKEYVYNVDVSNILIGQYKPSN